MQPSHTEFRKYTHDDLDAIVTLDALCFESLFRFNRSSMCQFAEADNAWTCLAFVHGILSGFLIVHLEDAPAGKVGYLVTIDVAAEHRRQGVGEGLLQAAEQWLAEVGARTLVLHVYSKNRAAIHFYESTGYRRGEENPDFYAPGADAIIYWKSLPASPCAG